jgi:hypothetical protein
MLTRCRHATAWLLAVLGAATQGCGARSDLVEERSCKTPEEFRTAEGAPTDCHVTEIVVCETTDGRMLPCPGTNASACGTPLVTANARCTNLCTDVAYALECRDHPVNPFAVRPRGAPEGCVMGGVPPDYWLGCCPCLPG